jgi:hypothetical protein
MHIILSAQPTQSRAICPQRSLQAVEPSANHSCLGMAVISNLQTCKRKHLSGRPGGTRAGLSACWLKNVTTTMASRTTISGVPSGVSYRARWKTAAG